MNEELILSTLAALMSTVSWTPMAGVSDPGRFITVSRRVRMFSDVPQAQQPACYQAEWSDTAQQTSNLPYKWILEVNWIVYQAVNNNPNAVGAIENNLILGGIRTALAPPPSDPGFHDRRNTLNGLVYHCFISGKVFKDAGDLDGQGMMVIPIKLLVP